MEFAALTGKNIQLFVENFSRTTVKLLDMAAGEYPKENTALVEAKILEARKAEAFFGMHFII